MIVSHPPLVRRGFSVMELLAAVAMLAVLMAGVPATLGIVAAHDRALASQRFALYELANLQTRIAAGELEPSLRPELTTHLPGATLAIDREPAGEWERVTLTLSWQTGEDGVATRHASLVSLQSPDRDAGEDRP